MAVGDDLGADAAALLEVIVGQSPVGVAVFDRHCRYVRVNPALQRLVGLDLADMLGRTVREVVPGPVGVFADERLREVVATGRPVVGADLEGRLPNSSTERSLVVSYFRLHGPDGDVLGAASIVSDVSDRHGTRRALERANARLELLGRVAAVMAGSLDLAETLPGLGRLVVPDVADHCVVDLLDDDATAPRADGGGQVELRRHVLVHAPDVVVPAAPGPGDAEHPWAPVGTLVTYPAGHPVHEAFHRGESVLRRIDPATFDYEAIAPSAASASSARRLEVSSALSVPLLARGRMLGVASFAYSVSGRAHGHDDVLLARQLADRAAVAIDNARLHRRERNRALALQRSLLPITLPVVPGMAAAARYLPARSTGDGSTGRPQATGGPGGWAGSGDSTGSEVGGDWYDVIRLPGGRVAMSSAT